MPEINVNETLPNITETKRAIGHTGIPSIDAELEENARRQEKLVAKNKDTVKTVEGLKKNIIDADNKHSRSINSVGSTKNNTPNTTPPTAPKPNTQPTPQGPRLDTAILNKVAQQSANTAIRSTTLPGATTPYVGGAYTPPSELKGVTTDPNKIVLTPKQQEILKEWIKEQSEMRSKQAEQGLPGGGHYSGNAAATQKLAQDIVNHKPPYPYVWGGAVVGGKMNSAGFDCSGLAQYMTQETSGVTLPRTSQQQYAATTPIDWADAQPGDLVFPGGTSAPGHVMVYVGDGKVVEAQQTGTNMMFSPVPPGSVVHTIR